MQGAIKVVDVFERMLVLWKDRSRNYQVLLIYPFNASKSGQVYRYTTWAETIAMDSVGFNRHGSLKRSNKNMKREFKCKSELGITRTFSSICQE